MITSCVPIVFNPILYNDKYYVDGGISNAFPIEICNKNTTLGFYIQTTNRKIDSLASVALASLSLLMQEPFKKYDNSYNIINFNNIDIGCVDFSVSNELKQKIFDMGMKEAEMFITNYNEKTISSDVNNDKQLVEVIINIL
jgi:predicted acylesterase/phospholipase RssA